jgi:WD40 repeat protein
MAFSSDGRLFASGSDDHTAILWDVDPDSWQATDCQKAGRNLFAAEWAQYLGDIPYQATCSQYPAGQ